MIDYEVFRQFGASIEHLGEMAQVPKLNDAERVSKAKEVMLRKIDRNMALDLEACVKCGRYHRICFNG